MLAKPHRKFCEGIVSGLTLIEKRRLARIVRANRTQRDSKIDGDLLVRLHVNSLRLRAYESRQDCWDQPSIPMGSRPFHAGVNDRLTNLPRQECCLPASFLPTFRPAARLLS
jgi:hypothetical protein